MLARVLVMALCPRLCPRLYVTSRCSVETGGWNNLGGFGMGASFDLSYTVLQGNSGIFKMRVLPSGTLLQTLDLENFATAYIDRRNFLSTLL